MKGHMTKVSHHEVQFFALPPAMPSMSQNEKSYKLDSLKCQNNAKHNWLQRQGTGYYDKFDNNRGKGSQKGKSYNHLFLQQCVNATAQSQ